MNPCCRALLLAALLLPAPSAAPAAVAAAAAAAAWDPAANASAHGAAQFAALVELGEHLNLKEPLLAAFNQTAEAWGNSSCTPPAPPPTAGGPREAYDDYYAYRLRCCLEPRVSCDYETGSISAISMVEENFAGPTSFPSDGWGAFSSLLSVGLHSTGLEGPLPPSDLPDSLQVLDLGRFSEAGALSSVSPAWHPPADLNRLTLANNAINQTLAELQPWMPSAAALQWLDLSANALRGTVPPDLALPPNLARLYMSSNRLTGTLPPLRLPASLYLLDFSNNSLHGTLPAGWELPDSLRYLILDSAGLTGTLPASVRLPPQLEVLSLNGNRLSGTIPAAWLPPGLFTWSAAQNQLTFGPAGGLPQLPPGLARLDISHNPLGGRFPALPPGIYELRLSNSSLGGPLPASLNASTVLSLLDASHNQLSGSLPATLLGQLPPHLGMLDLSNNALTGTIPRELVAPAGLYLELSNNSLSGSLPTAWRLGPGVRLGLAGNRLRGRLSAESLRNVAKADVSGNMLTGPLPAWSPRTDVGASTTLVVLPQRDGAGFCGEVPASPLYLRRDANGTEVVLGPGDLPPCP